MVASGGRSRSRSALAPRTSESLAGITSCSVSTGLHIDNGVSPALETPRPREHSYTRERRSEAIRPSVLLAFHSSSRATALIAAGTALTNGYEQYASMLRFDRGSSGTGPESRARRPAARPQREPTHRAWALRCAPGATSRRACPVASVAPPQPDPCVRLRLPHAIDDSVHSGGRAPNRTRAGVRASLQHWITATGGDSRRAV
jgi:hypothetical protein